MVNFLAVVGYGYCLWYEQIKKENRDIFNYKTNKQDRLHYCIAVDNSTFQ